MIPRPSDTFSMYDRFLGDRLAEGRGERRAILTDAGPTSYSEVHDAAGRFATLLRAAGVVPGDRVILAMDDGVDWVAAFFGILRTGGVVVMVNPYLAPDAIAYFFDYTTPRAALVGAGAAGSFREAAREAEHAPKLVVVGDADFRATLAEADPESPIHRGRASDPAIFLFSGGTTGRPKGVVQSHRSFVNTTELYGRGVLGIGEDDVTLSVPKLYFGYATGTNLLFPFSVGATSVLFPERCTTETLFEKIRSFRPTVLVNVPTMVNHMVGHPGAATEDLSCLRLATSAGEALPVELHRRWDDAFGVPLLDGLGTAEMWHIFISNSPGDVRPGTLGRPVPGFEVLACDDDGRPVAGGEVGVMRVRGDSLGIGYWQHEEKTAAAFRDGWYVSGDMISFDADGYVTYGGRADDMLKVSGKWLSPKELENCLLEHDAVREAAVVGLRTPEGLVKPGAFVVLDADRAPSDALAEELQAWAKSRLEPYKYPRQVTFLEDFPRTHLGKVDRGALARLAE